MMRCSYCAAEPATRSIPGAPATPAPTPTKTPRSGWRSGLASCVPLGMKSSRNDGTREDWPTLACRVTPAGSDHDTPSLGETTTKGPAWSRRTEGTTDTRPSASRHSSWSETEVIAQRGACGPASAKESPTEAEAESQWFPSGSVPSQLSEACHHCVSCEKKPPRKVLVSRRVSSRSEVSAPEPNA